MRFLKGLNRPFASPLLLSFTTLAVCIAAVTSLPAGNPEKTAEPQEKSETLIRKRRYDSGLEEYAQLYAKDLAKKYKLSDAETDYCGKWSNWFSCGKVYFHQEEALELAKNRYPGTTHNGNGDAFRHCYWCALMSRDLGAKEAEGFGLRHEQKAQNVYEIPMDFFNNEIGISIGQSKGRYESDAEKCARLVEDGKLLVYDGKFLVPSGPKQATRMYDDKQTEFFDRYPTLSQTALFIQHSPLINLPNKFPFGGAQNIQHSPIKPDTSIGNVFNSQNSLRDRNKLFDLSRFRNKPLPHSPANLPPNPFGPSQNTHNLPLIPVQSHDKPFVGPLPKFSSGFPYQHEFYRPSISLPYVPPNFHNQRDLIPRFQKPQFNPSSLFRG